MNSATEVIGAGINDVAERNDRGSKACDVIVIGAGPYGLAAGSHLKTKGIGVRVFGEPMEFWAKKMPEGMLLRSPRAASNISDARDAFTLPAYEKAESKEPLAPLPLDSFVEYGRWFRHQLGSDLDTRTVARVDKDQNGFKVTLEDGTIFRCRRVVVATGIGPFKRTPPVFAKFGPQQVSHCYDGRDVKRFAGKKVAVIGAGQSSLESAALLHEAGAEVELIVRRPGLRWIGEYKALHRMGLLTKILYSRYDIGPIGISRMVAYPNLMTFVPLALRDKIRKRAVRSAGSQWLKSRTANIKKNLSRYVTKAEADGNQLVLTLNDSTQRRVDHVLLGTGYDVDIAKFKFLPPELLQQIDQFEGYPKLKSGLQSSVPGLYFIGATAARSFGPLLYFVAGTEFAAPVVAAHISRNTRQTQ